MLILTQTQYKMKIKFEEVLSNKDWIHKELMHSLTGDIIEKAKKDEFYDVKLLVNGIEIEPSLFNHIMNNVEKYINSEATALLHDKLDKVKYKIRKLEELVDEASSKITDEFELKNI